MDTQQKLDRLVDLVREYREAQKKFMIWQEKRLLQQIDKELEKLFNIKKYIGNNLDKLAKVAELRCIDQRLSQRDMTKEEAIESYKKRYVEYMNHSQSDDDSDESQVDDILNIISIKENDLISWRESLKILFIVFNDGSH